MGNKREKYFGAGNVEGRYANGFNIGYNAFEFVFDFYQSYNEEDEEERPHTRIITSPAYAKALLETLGKSLEQYEKAFGEVEEKETV